MPQKIKMKYPKITSLYKYRAFNEYSLQSLINEVAWFSKPIDFNDPFDCGIQIDDLKVKESIQGAVKHIYAELGKAPPEISDEDFFVKDEDKKAFNDFKESISNLLQSGGIFSMSEVNDNILMWAHYADSHRGFCIEYARTPSNLLGMQAEPVQYEDKMPSLSIQDVTSEGKNFDKLWLTKSNHWKYEEEWRLIYSEGGKAFQFPCEIKSVIFGLKMSKQNRYTIQKIFEKKNISFSEALIEKGRFALRINKMA